MRFMLQEQPCRENAHYDQQRRKSRFHGKYNTTSGTYSTRNINIVIPSTLVVLAITLLLTLQTNMMITTAVALPPLRQPMSSISYNRRKIALWGIDTIRGGGFDRKVQPSGATVMAGKKKITVNGGGSGKNNDSKPSSSSPSSLSTSATVTGIKSFVASGLAAACAKILLAPFDTIKTMQQQHQLASLDNIRSAVINTGKEQPQKAALGLFETARSIMARPGGVWELYAGIGVAALGAMPSVGIYFGVYSYSKRKMEDYLLHKKEDDNVLSPAALRTIAIATSAAIGNTVASFSRVPFEVVKQKLQTGQYATSVGAVTSMFQSGGIKAFFPTGGISIQMVRDIPYAIFTLLSYEYLREHLISGSKLDDEGSVDGKVKSASSSSVSRKGSRPWKDMVAGGVAGGIGSYLTNPMDVIKTRLQMNPEAYGGSIMVCARATFEENGMRGFLRGSVPRLIHKVPANGAFFLFYELFRRVLQIDNYDKSESAN